MLRDPTPFWYPSSCSRVVVEVVGTYYRKAVPECDVLMDFAFFLPRCLLRTCHWLDFHCSCGELRVAADVSVCAVSPIPAQPRPPLPPHLLFSSTPVRFPHATPLGRRFPSLWLAWCSEIHVELHLISPLVGSEGITPTHALSTRDTRLGPLGDSPIQHTHERVLLVRERSRAVGRGAHRSGCPRPRRQLARHPPATSAAAANNQRR